MATPVPLMNDLGFRVHYRLVHDKYNSGSVLECWAVAFWHHVFKRYFDEVHFTLWPQQPPDPDVDSLRRADGRLTYIEKKDHFRLPALFFFEAKRMGTAPSLMVEVEDQAFQACQAYLEDNNDVKFVYAVTAIGTEARMWKYDLEDREESLEGHLPKGVRSAYIDADSPGSTRLRSALLQMKRHAPSEIEIMSPTRPGY